MVKQLAEMGDLREVLYDPAHEIDVDAVSLDGLVEADDEHEDKGDGGIRDEETKVPRL